MSNDIVHSAAARLWSDEGFQSSFKDLKLENVRYNLGPNHKSQIEVNFPSLLRAASIFSLVQHSDQDCDKYHDAAFRIAYISAKIWRDQPQDLQKVVALILSRIGNFPTIKKQLANNDLANFLNNLFKKLPHSFALEAIARYEGNSVRIGIGDDSSLLELTDFQNMLWSGLEDETDFLSFSSPTSSGKTYILQQFLVNKAINRVSRFRAIYVVPTRALITEIAHSLRSTLNSRGIDDIEVLSVGGDLDQDLPDKVIYVFTQERLLSFLSNTVSAKLSYIDFVVVDEAHQISEKARGTLLHQSLNWLKSSYKVGKYIFCSPVISNPQVFGTLFVGQAKHPKNIYMTEISPVAQNLLVVESVKRKTDQLKVFLHDSSGQKLPLSNEIQLEEKRKSNSKSLFLAYCAFYLGHGKRNIIYVDNPGMADNVADELIKLISKECEDKDVLDAANFIAEGIHSDFVLAKAMRYRIGIHYGKMPSLVRETVERLFKEEKLHFIICTSTLAQGVNLPAQNLFILDPQVRNPDSNTYESISRASFWNIVGRAGRLYKDFEGNVFLLKQPSNDEDWVDQYLSEEKLSNVIPATQMVVMEQRKELLEHITDPQKDAKKGIEEAASFIYDISRSQDGLAKELSWIPDLPHDAMEELKESTGEVEKKITLPSSVVRKNVGVSPVRQQALYDFLSTQLMLEDWLLPRSLSSHKEFHKVVCKILEFLDAPTMESERLKKYAWLYVGPAYDWVRGQPLNKMIEQELNWAKKEEGVSSLTPDKNNSYIRNLFEKIETNVRFKLVKYINCYTNIFLEVCHVKGRADLVEKMPAHLPLFLEIGASNAVQIDLISLGLSRMTAIELSKHIDQDSYDQQPKKLREKVRRLLLSDIKIPSVCAEEIRRYVL